MDEETVIEPQVEQVEEQSSSSGVAPQTSAAQSMDEIQRGMQTVGKMVEKYGDRQVAKADRLDGVAKKGADAVGNTVSSVAAKAPAALAKEKEAEIKVLNAAEKTAQTAEAVAAGTEAAFKGAGAVSKVGETVGEGLDAGTSTPYTIAGKPAAKVVKISSKVSKNVSKAGEQTAKAAKTSAKQTRYAIKTAKNKAKLEKLAAQNAAAAAKASKVASAGSKATKGGSLADKLREKGKLHQWRGKRMQELAEKFNSDELFKKIGGFGGKVLKALTFIASPTTWAVIGFIIVTVGTFIITYLLSPMFFMDAFRETALGTATFASNPDNVEKVKNYVAGLGFQDSEKAFYQEVNYLQTHYNNQLDFPYIMSALYYVDIFHRYDIDPESDSANLGVQLAKFYLHEVNNTVGGDGLNYSADKLYRLRALAKSQFLGDKQIVSLPLDEYIKKCAEQMDNENKRVMKYLPWVLAYIVAHSIPDPRVGIAFDKLILKTEEFKGLEYLISLILGTDNASSIKLKIENGELDSGLFDAFKNFVSTYLGSFYNIESININTASLVSIIGSLATANVNGLKDSLTNLFTVNYYEYSFSQEEYENYLIDHYIREMPEFSSLIKDAEGKIDENKITKIAYEIRTTRDIFASIYDKDKSALEYGQCIGDINVYLIDELSPPVSLKDGQKITFSGTNNYGFYKGKVHNGVDLEAGSTNTKKGDEVYSLYDGKVVGSTVDGTYQDTKVKGGWVMIQYTVFYEDHSLGESKLGEAFKNQMSTIIAIYGGLDPNDLKLKEGNIVQKGQVIGHVGDASVSETGEKASLHFAIYDVLTERYLNPINMFITCKASEDKMCGVTNEQKIWTFLLSKGYTKEAAAGIMGVWKNESQYKPYVVQNWGSYDNKSKSYTADVDSGKKTKHEFAHKGPNGGGYGLAQWTTPSRKEKLYDYAKEKGKSIGDLETQLEFFDKEIKSDYKGLKEELNSKTNTTDVVKKFLCTYQGVCNPKTKDDRIENAQKIFSDYENFSCKE